LHIDVESEEVAIGLVLESKSPLALFGDWLSLERKLSNLLVSEVVAHVEALHTFEHSGNFTVLELHWEWPLATID
jgi:hypothetical protein